MYRILQGQRTDKRFQGFNDISFVSSGIIRYFQEILGVAFHLTYGSNHPPSGGLELCPANQTKAVHLVSQHSLTTLSRNVETHGENLKYFLLDLADCLRHKLLHHTSEPRSRPLHHSGPRDSGNARHDSLAHYHSDWCEGGRLPDSTRAASLQAETQFRSAALRVQHWQNFHSGLRAQSAIEMEDEHWMPIPIASS